MHCFAKACHRTPCPDRQLPTPSCSRSGADSGRRHLSHKYEAEGLSAVLHATALTFPGARLVFAADATPARLHIELPAAMAGSAAGAGAGAGGGAGRGVGGAANGGSDVGLLYTCKVCEGGPTVPDPVSRNVTSCLFHGHPYSHPTLEAARKVHNCRYFTEPHLAKVCAALGSKEERTGRFGWFCNDVEKLQQHSPAR